MSHSRGHIDEYGQDDRVHSGNQYATMDTVTPERDSITRGSMPKKNRAGQLVIAHYMGWHRNITKAEYNERWEKAFGPPREDENENSN